MEPGNTLFARGKRARGKRARRKATSSFDTEHDLQNLIQCLINSQGDFALLFALCNELPGSGGVGAGSVSFVVPWKHERVRAWFP